MIDVKIENNDIIVRFPQNYISKSYFEKFIERLEIEELAEKNKMSENEAWELSEEIKKDWWEKNKESILKKIGIYEDNS